MAVFLLISLISLNLWLLSAPKAQGEKGVLGGPSPAVSGQNAGQTETALLGEPVPVMPDNADVSQNRASESLLEAGVLEGIATPGISKKNLRFAAYTGILSSAVDTKSYFILPTQGFDFGKVHPHNAVDIAGSCGTPIVAAADGLVTDLSLDSWSAGYGHYLEVSHPNGLKTKYAHLDEIFISLGQYVKQSDLLGTMGKTGDATGCHLHFEVAGASNPFAK